MAVVGAQLVPWNRALANNDSSPATGPTLNLDDFEFTWDLSTNNEGLITGINSLTITQVSAAWYDENAAPANLTGNWVLSVDGVGEEVMDYCGEVIGGIDSLPHIYNPTLVMSGQSLSEAKPALLITVKFVADDGQHQDSVIKEQKMIVCVITVCKFHGEYKTDGVGPRLTLRNAQIKPGVDSALKIKALPGNAGTNVDGTWKLTLAPNSGTLAAPTDLSGWVYNSGETDALGQIANWMKDYIYQAGLMLLSSAKATVTFVPNNPKFKGDSKTFIIDCDGQKFWIGDESLKYNRGTGTWVRRLAVRLSDELWPFISEDIVAWALKEHKQNLMLNANGVFNWPEHTRAEWQEIWEHANSHPEEMRIQCEQNAKQKNDDAIEAELKVALTASDHIAHFDITANEEGAELKNVEFSLADGPAIAATQRTFSITASGSYNFRIGNHQIGASLGASSQMTYKTSFEIKPIMATAGTTGMTTIPAMMKDDSNNLHPAPFEIGGQSEAIFVSNSPLKISITKTAPIQGGPWRISVKPETTVSTQVPLDMVVGNLSAAWPNDGRVAIKIKQP